MKRQLMLFAGLAVLAAPVTAQADPYERVGTVVLTYAQCDWAEMQRIRLIADSVMVPTAQELVDEGLWFHYGALFHDVGDEWNVVFFYVAENRQAFFEAWEEYIDRLDSDHPGLYSWFLERCQAHKENVYEAGPFTVLRRGGRP